MIESMAWRAAPHLASDCNGETKSLIRAGLARLGVLMAGGAGGPSTELYIPASVLVLLVGVGGVATVQGANKVAGQRSSQPTTCFSLQVGNPPDTFVVLFRSPHPTCDAIKTTVFSGKHDARLLLMFLRREARLAWAHPCACAVRYPAASWLRPRTAPRGPAPA